MGFRRRLSSSRVGSIDHLLCFFLVLCGVVGLFGDAFSEAFVDYRLYSGITREQVCVQSKSERCSFVPFGAQYWFHELRNGGRFSCRPSQ